MVGFGSAPVLPSSPVPPVPCGIWVGQNQVAFMVSASPDPQIAGSLMHAEPPEAVVQPYTVSVSHDTWSA